MNKMRLYIVGFVTLVCAWGCRQYNMEEILMTRDDVSLTIKGEPVFVYDADNCQTAYNLGKNEYRAMTDDMTQYFVLKANQGLSHIGQKFSADLTYNIGQKEKTEKGLTFEIEKISNAKGLVWLWCSSRSIGLVIRVF